MGRHRCSGLLRRCSGKAFRSLELFMKPMRIQFEGRAAVKRKSPDGSPTLGLGPGPKL